MDVIGRLMMRPPILQSTFQEFFYYIMGPLLFKDKRFIAFLGDPWAKHLEGSYTDKIASHASGTVHIAFRNQGNINFPANSSFFSSTIPCVAGSNHSRGFPDDSFLDSSVRLLDFGAHQNWDYWHIQ
jgi:hypothetical protein